MFKTNLLRKLFTPRRTTCRLGMKSIGVSWIVYASLKDKGLYISNFVVWANAIVSPLPVPIIFVEPACRLWPNIEAIPAGIAHSSAPVSMIPKVAYESPVCGLMMFIGRRGREISSLLSLRNGQSLSGISIFAPYPFWERKIQPVPLHPFPLHH